MQQALVVSIYQRQEDLFLDNPQIEALVREVFSLLEVATHEIILNFVSEKEICELHKAFFNDPSPTDCITFPIDNEYDPESYSVIGEAFICPSAAIEFSKEKPYDEVTLYIIHCILHLLGYDDIEESDRMKMREEESRILSHLSEKKISLSKEKTAKKFRL